MVANFTFSAATMKSILRKTRQKLIAKMILKLPIMLLLTNCEVHTGKYLDRSFEVRTERSEVRTKN